MSDTPTLTIESKTQSAETIKKIMEDQGYGDIETNESTDTPIIPPPADEVVVPPGEESETIPSETDLGETAGEVEDEPGQTPEAVVAPQESKKSKGGFARKLEKQAVELDSLKATLTELNRRLAEKPAAPAEKPAVVAKTEPVIDQDPEPVMGEDEEWESHNAKHTRWLVRDERRQAANAEREREASAASARKATSDESARLANEQEAADATERWNRSRERMKTERPDSEEVFKRLLDPAVNHGSPAMGQVARDYEEIGELLYYLGTHPEEEQRITAKSQLPENFAQLGPRAQMRAIRVVEDLVREEYDQILTALPAQPAAPATDARRETPAAAAPVAVPAVAPRPPAPKMAPPKTVGHRGSAVTKRYPQDYSPAELRALSQDDVRKIRGMESA